MNAKISLFVTFVVAIIYLLLHNYYMTIPLSKNNIRKIRESWKGKIPCAKIQLQQLAYLELEEKPI